MSNSRIRSLILAAMLICSTAWSDTFPIDNTAPNRWAGIMAFTGPCGIQMQDSNNPNDWFPPIQVDTVTLNSPSNLCATKMRTLTDPDSVSVTSIGAINSSFKNLPDGTPLPPLASGGTQDPLNVPTAIIEASTSGSMTFQIPVSFRDTSDTAFDGQADAALESPYDATQCPDPVGINPLPEFNDPWTGLRTLSTVPFICVIATPAQYINALKQGHLVNWAQITYGSLIGYGPTDTTMPSGAAAWQRQSVGGQVQGMISLPYLTSNNSTVLRIAIRYSIGYKSQIPLVWGGWPTPVICSEQSRRDDTCLMPTNGWGGMQTPWIYSQPFTLQVQPVSLVQFHFLPVTLIYNPPGNQSSASISTTETTTQSYQIDQTLAITSQDDFDNKTKSDFSFSNSLSFDSNGVGGSYDDTTSWDNSSKTVTGAAYGQSVSSVISLGKAASYSTAKDDATAPDYSTLTYQTEPFWSDQIVAAIHPQFAVWDYPDPRGQNPQGQTLSQALGASAIQTFTIQQLLTCLPVKLPGIGPGLDFTYDTLAAGSNQTVHNTEHLSSAECVQLLDLDPFFVGRSQSAAPPVSVGVSIPPAARSLTTGIHTDKETYITSTSTKTTTTTTIKASLTSVRQNAFSQSLTLEAATGPIPYYKESAKFSEDTTKTLGATVEVDVSLGDTESSQTQVAFESTINLADCPLVSGKSSCSKTPAAFPNVEVFQDLRFGTLMGVLPDLPIIAPPVIGPASFKPQTPAKVTSSAITGSVLTLATAKTLPTKPLTVVRGTAVHVGGPVGPGPVTVAAKAKVAAPLSVGRGVAVSLPKAWQGRIFSTAKQATIPLQNLKGPPTLKPVPIVSPATN